MSFHRREHPFGQIVALTVICDVYECRNTFQLTPESKTVLFNVDSWEDQRIAVRYLAFKEGWYGKGNNLDLCPACKQKFQDVNNTKYVAKLMDEMREWLNDMTGTVPAPSGVVAFMDTRDWEINK